MKEYVISKELDGMTYYFTRIEENQAGMRVTYVWTAHAEDAKVFYKKKDAEKFIREYEIPGEIRIETY